MDAPWMKYIKWNIDETCGMKIGWNPNHNMMK